MRFDYRFSDKATMYVRVTRETQIDDGAYGILVGALQTSNFRSITQPAANVRLL